MIDLTEHLEELREICHSMTAEKLNAFMKERGYDYTFEDVKIEDQYSTKNKFPITINSKRVKGAGLGTEINFPTINCVYDGELSPGVYGTIIYKHKLHWFSSKAISSISKTKDGKLRIETHVLGYCNETFAVGEDVSITLYRKLRDYIKITNENRTEIIENDKKLGNDFFNMKTKCDQCKFFVREDYGYSNWTVEGTTYKCLKKCFADTEDGNITRSHIDCLKYSRGEPWDLDVDGETPGPTDEWLRDNLY